MEFESTNSNTTAKLPILKLAQENGTSVMKMYVPVTVEEKTNKNNDVKARSLLLMALPNEHQLTFSQYPDAKIITSSTNHVNTTMPAYKVSTASPDVNIASPQVSTASFSDNDVYAFMLENPNGSNLLQTCKKIFINANDTAGYDKSKVECFNCHKMGHFAKECRAPRSKEGQFKNQDNTRK
ncbi:putative ribonuclease H-like domain-containing protein [Tanacetum coccineum]